MSVPDTNAQATAAIDTNAEYISAASGDTRPVLLSVSKAIIVETVKDFFGSIIGFFLRYIKHFVTCIRYFFVPSLQKKPFNGLDFKENAQHTFEFLIIIVALVIFMEKLEWIPTTTEDIMALYSNDLMQKFTEVWFFILFAVLYLASAAIAIFSGRFFRMIFKINVLRKEGDILFSYLNNAFFSIAAAFAFVLRCMAATATHDQDSLALVVSSVLGPIVLIGIAIWSIRFAGLHQLRLGKGIAFFVCSLIFYSILFFCSGFFLTSLLLGI